MSTRKAFSEIAPFLRDGVIVRLLAGKNVRDASLKKKESSGPHGITHRAGLFPVLRRARIAVDKNSATVTFDALVEKYESYGRIIVGMDKRQFNRARRLVTTALRKEGRGVYK